MTISPTGAGRICSAYSYQNRFLDKAKDDVPLAAKKLAEEDEKPDSQKLVALCPMGSEEAKQYLGAEWKNAQFVVLIHGKHEYFPRVWDYKDTGCTIRAKIVGGKIAKRLHRPLLRKEQRSITSTSH
ncbi:hypothetical protein DTO271G3_1547 [Paecilomyces variotii]|nr:hypothetical protein DTO271G3_1547 [Paecilomyces variotii]